MNAPLMAGTVATGSTPVGPVLHVQNLVKSYGGPLVLQGVSFSAYAGVSLAVIGANGSGKSTLLKCLIRLTDPTSGWIEMLGQNVGSLTPAALRRFRSRVGVVWQKHNLVPRLSALSQSVSEQSALLQDKELKLLPVTRLESIERHWRFFQGQLDAWRGELQQATEQPLLDAAEIGRREAAWALTAAAAQTEPLPEALAARIVSVQADLTAAKQAISPPIAN